MPETIDKIIDRIAEAVGAVTQRQLAEMLEISPARINDAKKSKSIPPGWLVKLSTDYDINPNWILTGNGSKTITTVTANNGSIVGNKNTQTGNISVGRDIIQGETANQYRNPDVQILAKLIDEMESPIRIKKMIRDYEKMREEFEL